MATFDGTTRSPTTYLSQGTLNPGSILGQTIPALLGNVMVPMQAVDSVTGTLYRWEEPKQFGTTRYNGPNSASNPSQWAPIRYY